MTETPAAVRFWADELARAALSPSAFESFYETRRRSWWERIRSRPFRKTKRVLKERIDGNGVTVTVVQKARRWS